MKPTTIALLSALAGGVAACEILKRIDWTEEPRTRTECRPVLQCTVLVDLEALEVAPMHMNLEDLEDTSNPPSLVCREVMECSDSGI